MPTLTEFCSTVRSWVDDLNPSDTLVTSWVRIAEERMNNELRVDEMIVRTIATFSDDCVVLPDNWLKTIYVKPVAEPAYTFVSNKAYFDGLPDDTGRYTNVGRSIFVWPPIDPDALTQIEIGYYAKVPPLGDTTNPIIDRFPGLYLNCTLAAGQPYLIEDERLATFSSLATAAIQMANNQAIAARFSGSPITSVQRRSFG